MATNLISVQLLEREDVIHALPFRRRRRNHDLDALLSGKALSNAKPADTADLLSGRGQGELNVFAFEVLLLPFGLDQKFVSKVVHRIVIDNVMMAAPSDPSSATRPTRALKYNLDAMAGFAAAPG